VGQYVVLSRVGGGSQGVVYRALDTQLNRQVALKFILPQCCRDDEVLERFVREAQAGAAATHANVCAIHGLESTDDGRLFIVMAFYEGRTLKQRLELGALAVAEAVTMATQVAGGLAAAHDEGIVHGDVKPGNLMLARDGVKLRTLVSPGSPARVSPRAAVRSSAPQRTCRPSSTAAKPATPGATCGRRESSCTKWSLE
jgi:serine/threonine-protein kinase